MLHSGFMAFKLEWEETKRLATGDVVHSEVVYAGGHPWRIRCHPCGHTNDDRDYISIFLELMDESKGVKAIFDAFVVDKDGKPSCSSSLSDRCVQVYPPEGFKAWGWAHFAKRTHL